MHKIFTLAFSAALLGSTAQAQVTSMASSNPAPKGSAQDLSKIVCEVDQTTGTRLGASKVCKTVLEWQQQRLAHRQGVEEVQRMGTSTGCPEGIDGPVC